MKVGDLVKHDDGTIGIIMAYCKSRGCKVAWPCGWIDDYGDAHLWELEVICEGR